MPTAVININSDSLVRFTDMLEGLNARGMPHAVRNSLNSAAFDVKGVKGKRGTMRESASKQFTERDKNFFRVISTVVTARGINISKMRSMVGLTERFLKGESGNTALEGLQKQERGGEIQDRSFIPLQAARVGGSKRRRVRPKLRLARITKIVDAEKTSGKSPGQKYIIAAREAGVGGFVLGNLRTSGGVRFLMRIDKINNQGVKAKAIYSFKEGRSVNVDSTLFMRSAAVLSGTKLPFFYKEAVEAQIKRFKQRNRL